MKNKKYKFLIILLILPILFCSCKDNAPKDIITDIVISEEFFEAQFYQYESPDLSEFNVTVKFSISQDKVFPLDQMLRKNLQTTTVGESTFTLTYLGFSKTFSYNVNPVRIIRATFKNSPLTLYKNQTPDLSNLYFVALYANGSEQRINLSLATIDFELDSVCDQPKTAIAQYENISFSVKYTVTNPPLKQNQYYSLDDQTDTFDQNCLILFNQNNATIYTQTNGVPSPLINIKIIENATEENHNTCLSKIYNPNAQYVRLYLENDKIICEYNM